MLEDLKRKPYFAVRLGEVYFRGWTVKQHKLNPNEASTTIQLSSNDLVPNVQQKGVDMRIGLDISSLSLKNQVDVCVGNRRLRLYSSAEICAPGRKASHVVYFGP